MHKVNLLASLIIVVSAVSLLYFYLNGELTGWYSAGGYIVAIVSSIIAKAMIKKRQSQY